MIYDSIPRRNQLEKMTPSERAILDAVRMVESFGASTHLTEAVILLQKARDKVADFVDGVNHPLVSYDEEGGAAVENLRLALARIKSLENDTSVIEQELRVAKDVLIARDEDFHPKGEATLAEVVERILGERDAARSRIKSLEDGIVAENKRTNLLVNELQADVKHYKRGVANWLAKSQGVGRPCGGCRGCGDDSSINTNACVGSKWIAPKETLDKVGVDDGELDSIRAMLADTAEDPAAELVRLREPNETAAAVSALLSHDKARESSFKAQSQALDAAEERVSAATDILCMALGKDHGRGGLVEHCQKAAEKIRTLEVRLAVWQPQVVGAEPVKCLSCYTLSAKLVEAERERDESEKVRGELVQRCLEFQQRAANEPVIKDEPTPHKHYDDEPHRCARCSCEAYRALLALPESTRREAYPPPKLTDLVSREQLIAACKRATSFAGLALELERP